MNWQTASILRSSMATAAVFLCHVPGHSSSSDSWSVRSSYRPVRSSPSMTVVPPGCGS